MLDHFEIFNLFSIPSYNIFIGVGLIAGFISFEKSHVFSNLKNSFNVYNAIFISFLFAFLGSRVFDLFFLKKAITVDNFFSGSSAFLGGLVLFITSLYLFLKVFKFKPMLILHLLIVPILLAHFFGRIGCFFAGCCFGKPCSPSNFLAVTFPKNSIPYNHLGGNYPIHPTQLYEALGEGLLLFLILSWFASKPRLKGEISGLFLLLYGFIRFLIEFVRQPDVQFQDVEALFEVFNWMTQGQWLCVPMIVAGFWLMRTALWSGYKKSAGGVERQ